MNGADRERAHARSAGIGALCVLAASVLWGTTGTAATFAPGVGPLAIGAVAMGVGGLLQALMAAPRISHHASRLRERRGTVLLGAVSVAVYPLAFYSSMHLAGVAVGTVVSIGTAPLASALIERVVDGRRLTRRWMLAASLGLLGTVLLCVAEAAHASGGSGQTSATTTLLGIALGLVAAATYALYSWAAHRLITHRIPSRAAMGAVFGLGGLLLLPVLAVTGAPLVASWSNAAVGIYMALIPMFAGYVLFGWGLAHVPASTATTLSLLEPAVAAVLAVLVVGERLPAAGWTGIALVIACLAVLTAPARRGSRRPSPDTVPSSARPVEQTPGR
ncbi:MULTISPECIES: DMT family transporter [Streptomyces]|uniref:DMT family transporter n=1 Tax=Streptomyces TaxID=1883 RepID=UPI00210BC4DF|nr:MULTISPECIES: DMT family transporter [Streptomyces]UUA07300.1 DMT family transporter [Streptomyces koelreuteriae]UUA14929.1 DMT family transporter [Streptomyces sp. CRCS-T-1]